MSAGKLAIAVIGQGFMGRVHSLAWAGAAKLPGTSLHPEVAVLCGRDPEALQRNSVLLGFGQVSTDWREVVTRDDIDLVDVCVPGASHAEIALGALDAGKHVLCEKPLANTVGQARAMAEAAARAAQSGRYAMVGFNYRRVPALALASRLIAEGRIGAVRHVRAQYLQDWLTDPEFPLTWRLDAEQAGSGALGDLGAHLIDLIRFLTSSEVAEVAALHETFVRERPLPAQVTGLSATAAGGGRAGTVTVDDASVAVARLSNGALATIEATRMAPGHKNGMIIELNGSAGSIAFDLERLNELHLYTREAGGPGDGFRDVLVTNPGDPYVAQWWPPGHMLGWEHTFIHQCQDLMAAIADGRQPSPSFADGLAVQLVLEAIERSSAEGRFVAL
jgi:predicted dehydrogenase